MCGVGLHLSGRVLLRLEVLKRIKKLIESLRHVSFCLAVGPRPPRTWPKLRGMILLDIAGMDCVSDKAMECRPSYWEPLAQVTCRYSAILKRAACYAILFGKNCFC